MPVPGDAPPPRAASTVRATALRWSLAAVVTAAIAWSRSAAAESDAEALRAYLRQSYPSLGYVERFRRDFPEDVPGTAALWSGDRPAPDLTTPSGLVQALVGLGDGHVRLAGPRAGKSETLGALFRTSSDGHMIVWRVVTPGGSPVREGDVVLSVDGVATAAWLERAARAMFGGNPRSRAAEAALNLGFGAHGLHQDLALGDAVTLVVQRAGASRTITLPYQAMPSGAALSAALNRADLPRTMTAGGLRIGTLRWGAFAPQFDPAFNAAADAAAKLPGTTDDQAMVAGFCALARAYAAEVDALAARSDVLVLDLRGNLGGFGREARLLADAMTPAALVKTYDVFATGHPGAVRLAEQPVDPPCSVPARQRPIVVFVDAGTRSSGEFMATWLWSGGAIVVGERTIGAGGGRDADAKGFELPSGIRVLVSGNFSVFDPAGQLAAGELPEQRWIDQVAADRFARSRTRPFAIQGVGVIPDLASHSSLADLRDGGVAELQRAIAQLRAARQLR